MRNVRFSSFSSSSFSLTAMVGWMSQVSVSVFGYGLSFATGWFWAHTHLNWSEMRDPLFAFCGSKFLLFYSSLFFLENIMLSEIDEILWKWTMNMNWPAARRKKKETEKKKVYFKKQTFLIRNKVISFSIVILNLSISFFFLFFSFFGLFSC